MIDDGLFETELNVVNVGLDTFHETLEAIGPPVVDVDWNPPDGGGDALNCKLTTLHHEGDRIAEANEDAFDRPTVATAIWTHIEIAADAIDWLGGRTLLHAGPPVKWAGMSVPPTRRGDGRGGQRGVGEASEEATEAFRGAYL